MIGQASVILIAVLQVISAQQGSSPPPGQPHLPVQCRRLPQGVKKKPHQCCMIPKFFEDADLEKCGFRKEGVFSPMGLSPPNCSKQTCVLEKYNLSKGEEIDYRAMNKFMDTWAAANPEFKDSVSTSKKRCIGKQLPGPPHVCEATKIVFCVSTTLIDKCPKSDETDGCQKLKDHIEGCSPYFKLPNQ